MTDRKEYRKAWLAKNPEYKKDWKLKKLYGLELEDYKRLLEQQGGVCAICGKGETVIDKKTGLVRSLSVDHNHINGNVRGLLCNKCNRALGLFEDDPELLLKAFVYMYFQY